MSAHQYWQTVGAAEVQCDDDYIDRINRLIDEAMENDNGYDDAGKSVPQTARD